MMKKGNLFVISGPSGVGKNTVINEFLKNNKEVKLSISCTTRLPRQGEKDGINYFFLTKEEFENDIKEGKFLEWAEFNGNFYGTKQEYVEKTLANQQDIILEIDTQGAMQIKKKLPDAVLIFIAPPSREVLENRLKGRGTESEDVVQKRLNIAIGELEKMKDFDFVIVNDDLSKAANELKNIIKRKAAK